LQGNAKFYKEIEISKGFVAKKWLTNDVLGKITGNSFSLVG